MRKLSLLLVLSLFSFASFAQNKWNVDTYHSFLNFSVKHLGISYVDGRFDSYQGVFNGNPEDLTTGDFKFTVDLNSVNTAVSMRDDHLKSADFFDVAKYPTMSFESTSIEKIQGDKYALKGNLTIKGITKPVVFELVYGGLLADDGQGNTKIGFQGVAQINRFDFDIAYDPAAQGIAQDVEIQVNLEFNQEK